MRSLWRLSIAVLVGFAACMQVFPVWAVNLDEEARRTKQLTNLELAAMPSLGELQVGDRLLKLERVQNGFVARDLDSGEGIVITDEALQQFVVSTPLASSDRARRVRVMRQQLFGVEEAFSVEVDEVSDVLFVGTVVHGDNRIPIAYRSSAPASLAGSGLGDSGALRRANGEVIIVIVLSAAAVGALACAALGWWTDCIGDCGEACTENGGKMESASEGYCGTCSCECQTDPLAAG